ncbi:MAG: ATP-binding protein [Gemmatimonadota bacterium]
MRATRSPEAGGTLPGDPLPDPRRSEAAQDRALRGRPFLSIRGKVMASTVLVLFLITVFTTIYYPGRQRRAALDAMRAQTTLLAEMVALSVGIGLELNQLSAVQAAVNWAKQDQSLAYVHVVDPGGQIFASYNPDDRPIDIANELAHLGQIREGGGLVRLSVPVVFQERSLGTLSLATSLEATLAEIDRFRWTALLVSLAALALGSALAMFFAHRITTPLRTLRNAADRVARGDLEVTIRPGGGDEVGRLARAFGVMVGRLRAMLAELEDRGRSLARARDEAVAAARAKADFLAAMSHEIRTPMNGVLGMLALLGDTGLTPKQQEYLRTADGSARALLTVINDILDFSKLEAGKIETESIPYPLRETTEEVVRLVAERARRRGLTLSCLIEETVPDRVVGDPVRTRQILQNLLDNAVKFTTEGGVHVHVRRETAAEGDRVQFEVVDTGIGLAPDVQARLFQPFTQADASTTRRFGGTGLGLSIVRRLVEKMGGEVGVRSVPGQGSTFWFWLPLQAAGGDTSLPHERLLAGFRVVGLVPLDEERKQILHHLVARGAAVDLVAEEERLAERLGADAKGQLPDVMLLPSEWATRERVGALRGQGRLDGVRIIVMAPVGERLSAAVTVDGCVERPVRRDELLSVLGLALGRLQAPLTSHPRAATLPRSGPRRGHLLLAEDHEVNRQLAVEVLTQAGYTVEVVENGVEAVDARFRAEFDVVLMDCQMPEMDGIEATRTIRRREWGRRAKPVPIVALTANAITGDRETCMAAGMDDYLAKPFMPAELLDMVQRWAHPEQAPSEDLSAPEGTTPSAGSETVVDLHRLGTMLGGDETKIRKYLHIFADVTETQMEALKDALEAGHSDDIRRLAHKTKGSAAMIGAARLAELAAEIERAAACEDLAAVGAVLGDLVAEFASVQAFALEY